MSYYPADFRVFGNVTPWPNRGRISAADSSPSSRRGENPSKVRVAHHTTGQADSYPPSASQFG